MKKNRIHKDIKKMIARRRSQSYEHHKVWKINQRKALANFSKKDRPKKASQRRSNKGLSWVTAPENFSFNENTNEVVEFVSRIEKLYNDEKGVYVDLKRVNAIDYGSIVTLLTILIKFKRKNLKLNGNFPKDDKCEKILNESGFIYNLYRKKNDDELYCISNGKDNSPTTYGWRKVDAGLGAKIIKESAETIWGEPKRCQGVQRCLGELMLNTNNHANPNEKGALNWWLYVNHDGKRKVVSFAFVDFGIGIFESLKNKPATSIWAGWIDKLKDSRYDSATVLKMIMSGDFHKTVTGKYYRGKGLPGISEALNRNQISNLKIVSNNAVGDVENGRYTLIDACFSGTYVYWELNADNEHCAE